MCLVNRANADPGIHVFIAGVSAYANLPQDQPAATRKLLGLKRLQSTALTGFRIADWLMKRRDSFSLPLASVRLLLAPSEAEIKAEPRLAELNHGCTFEDFRLAAEAWRKDMSSNAGNIGIFYFAGHGVQSDKGHVLLMEDFGANPSRVFSGAASTEHLIDGMLSTWERPAMGRTQLYFIDACRVAKYLDGLDVKATDSLWDTDRANDHRALSIFYAASEGQAAYAWPGKQTLYSQALIECLEDVAAKPEPQPQTPGRSGWCVSVVSLHKVLKEHMQKVCDGAKATDQNCETQRLASEDTILHFLDAPPQIDVSIAVNPTEARVGQISVLDSNFTDVDTLPVPIDPHPFRTKIPMGLYSVFAKFDPDKPFKDKRASFHVLRESPEIVIHIESRS